MQLFLIVCLATLLNTAENDMCVDIGCELFSTPCITGNELIFGTTNGDVICINRKDGSRKWMVDGYFRVDSDPVCRNGLVYFASADNKVNAIDATTGNRMWATEIDGAGYSDPVAGEDGLLVSGKNLVCMLNYENGKITWSAPIIGEGQCVVADKDNVYVSSSVDISKNNYSGDGSVVCIDLKSKRQIWKYTGDGANLGSIMTSNSSAFWGDRSGHFYSVDKKTGNEVWKIDCRKFVKQSDSPVWADGHILLIGDALLFMVHHQNIGDPSSLVSVNQKTGMLNWKVDSKESLQGSIVEKNGVVYAVNQAREILMVTNENGESKKYLQLCNDDERGEFAGVLVDGNGMWIHGADGKMRFITFNTLNK